MSQTIITVSQLVLVFSVLLLTLGVLFFIERWFRKFSGFKNEIRFSLEELNSQLKQCEMRLANLSKRFVITENTAKNEEITYNFAEKILESGGSIEEVIDGCSLTHGEAELLSALKKLQSNAKTTEVLAPHFS